VSNRTSWQSLVANRVLLPLLAALLLISAVKVWRHE
jgi:hypothetical protein